MRFWFQVLLVYLTLNFYKAKYKVLKMFGKHSPSKAYKELVRLENKLLVLYIAYEIDPRNKGLTK